MMAVAALTRFGAAEAKQVALAENGKPLAEIVLAKDADRAAKFAAYELKWHLDRITGGSFAIVKEDKATGLRPIYVGPCGATRAKGADFRPQQFLVDVREDAIELVGLDKADKGAVTYYNDEKGVRGVGWPGMFDEQGSLYAVYDFLEFTVGVKWLDATDYGTLLPKAPSLAVETVSRRGEPFIRYRAHSGVANRYEPVLWKKSEPGYAAYMDAAFAVKGKTERARQGELFQIRHRLGGECAPANHSLYYFYDRYWKKDSKTFVAFRPEFFAKGYADGTIPPQLCYSNPETVKQVIADIREYFDNPKGPKRWGKDSYCLEPMDNSSFCKCETCTKEYEPEREPENADQSTHWYRFVNKVAKAIKESHPTKRLTTLAYFNHEGLPTGFKLEDNVTVYFCLSCNRHCGSGKGLDAQIARMTEWRKAYPDQPLAMWLYNCFPSEAAHNNNFHCFPGFFAKEEQRQYDLFRELNARAGIFHCGFDGEVDNYIQLEKMIDPTRDVKVLLDEFFSMYGKAAPHLRAFYELVESRFCDRSLYAGHAGHQNAALAWGVLGTKDVMDKLADLMAKAEAAAETPEEKARVNIWKLSVWNYMKEGFDAYTVRMASPQPEWTAKRVADAGGDSDKVDWAKAGSYPIEFFAAGGNEPCGYAGNLRFAHDGKWFYFELTMVVPDTKTLVNLPGICSHDCWEMLIARQKGLPYRCWFSAPDGRMTAASWGEVNWRSGVPSTENSVANYGARCKTDLSDGKSWITRYAMPLDTFLDGPIAPGGKFYLNATNCMGREHPEVVKWLETHGGRFIMSTLTSYTTVHTTDRIGTVTLEK